MSDRLSHTPNDLNAHWIPFTPNRSFKKNPRLLASAEGMYYKTPEGRDVLDMSAGLWCVNAGHCRPRIVQAIQAQVAELDYAPGFQLGHPKSFELANRLIDLSPEGMDKVFFTNSGSECVDTALKMALAYHRSCGEASRTRFIGRERGYHGVNFGGISVGGIVANRKMFGTMLSGVDHLRHTHMPDKNAFSKGQPPHGVELADDLERLCALHDPSTIAAVIVEPVAGSTGVLPPPPGYLKRLREICDAHGILLIFDEVITGYGRLGTNFAAQYFDVIPDMITSAKGLTNGVIPMGAVFARNKIHDAMMNGPEHLIEFFHGYTYSGNPVAAAAALATLETYEEEALFERAGDLSGYFETAIHSLKGSQHVIDIRNIGLMGAVELAPESGMPGKRGYEVFVKAFEQGVLFRLSGDTLAFSPPFIVEKSQIDRAVSLLSDILSKQV